jgi:hypothetical protein
MKTMQKRIEQAGQSRQALKIFIQEIYSELSAESELALINLWGVRGSGKTELLTEIGQTQQALPDAAVLGPINAAQLPYSVMAARINTFVENAPDQAKKVLLIDDLESIAMEDGSDRADFLEFESQVILKLIQRPDILFVISSRHELGHWHHIEIKMRQVSLMLPADNPEEIEALAREIHSTPGKVYALTYGNTLALEYLQAHPATTEAELDEYIHAAIVGELPENIQDIALLTSLLLDFDIAVLQSALNVVGLHAGESYHDHTTSIQKLGISGLIIHDIRQGGFHFTNEPLRRLLSRIYRSRHPDCFEAVHQQMALFYQREARRSSFLPQFLVNVIYHMAWSNAHTGKNIGTLCQEWIQETLPFWAGASWKEVVSAWKTGRGKPDVVREIIELIGESSFHQITNQIQAAGRA